MKNKFLYDIWARIGSLMGVHKNKREDSPQQSVNKIHDKIDVFEVYVNIIQEKMKCLDVMMDVELKNSELPVSQYSKADLKHRYLCHKQEKLDLEVELYAKKDFIHNYENRKKFYEEYNKELTEKAERELPHLAQQLEKLLPNVPQGKEKVLAYGKLYRLVSQPLTIPQRNQLFQEIEDLLNTLKQYGS